MKLLYLCRSSCARQNTCHRWVCPEERGSTYSLPRTPNVATRLDEELPAFIYNTCDDILIASSLQITFKGKYIQHAYADRTRQVPRHRIRGQRHNNEPRASLNHTCEVWGAAINWLLGVLASRTPEWCTTGNAESVTSVTAAKSACEGSRIEQMHERKYRWCLTRWRALWNFG